MNYAWPHDSVRDALCGLAWEDLCRQQLPRSQALASFGQWNAPQRWWSGNAPEWDLVAETVDGARAGAGESKFARRPLGARELEAEVERLASRRACLHGGDEQRAHNGLRIARGERRRKWTPAPDWRRVDCHVRAAARKKARRAGANVSEKMSPLLRRAKKQRAARRGRFARSNALPPASANVRFRPRRVAVIADDS
jgi:hypothetical protein